MNMKDRKMEHAKATVIWEVLCTVVRVEEDKIVIAAGEGFHIAFPIKLYGGHVKPGDTATLTLDLTQKEAQP